MEDEDGWTMHPSIYGQAASATQMFEGWQREAGDTFLPFSITTGVKEWKQPLKGKTQTALGSHTLKMKKYLYSVHSLQAYPKLPHRHLQTGKINHK